MTLDTSPKTHGEPSIEALASGLGTLGRYGDNYMVHAAEGETVVPREVLEANPGLKEDLFRQMTMMGIEDPNRYVVGDQLNSINPITGQPEFFFKKIFRAIKKVVKKAAPIIAPIVGNLIAPGIGGIIASGLMTKAQGGSWGDALKSAALSWGAQGLMSGIGSATSGGSFMEGLGKGLSTPFDAASNLFSSGAANPLQQGIFGTAGVGNLPGATLGQQIFRQYNPNAALAGQGVLGGVPEMKLAEGYGADQARLYPSRQTIIPENAQSGAIYRGEIPQGSGEYIESVKSDLLTNVSTDGSSGLSPRDFALERAYAGDSRFTVGDDGVPYFKGQVVPAKVPVVQPASPTTGPYTFDEVGGIQPPSAAERALKSRGLLTPKELASRGINIEGSIEQTALENPIKYDLHSTAADAGEAVEEVINDRGYLGKYVLDPIERTLTPLMGEQLAGKAAPWLAGAGALGLAGYATGAFDDDPPPPPNATQRQMAAYDAYLAAKARGPMPPEQHLKMRAAAGIVPQYTRSQMARIIGRDISGLPDYYFARGRAGGGEVMGPGTGTSDSIPARLSDGEFVMTARAVRNAGGGDRSLGAARMYDMMNRFEQGAA